MTTERATQALQIAHQIFGQFIRVVIRVAGVIIALENQQGQSEGIESTIKPIHGAQFRETQFSGERGNSGFESARKVE